MAGLAVLFLGAAFALAACGGGSSTGSTGGSATTAPTTSAGNTSEAQVGEVGDVGLVSSYCLYRSDTKAQMLDCEATADPDEIRSLNDDAARWARGELQTCGKGAGALCEKLNGAILNSQIGQEAR